MVADTAFEKALNICSGGMKRFNATPGFGINIKAGQQQSNDNYEAIACVHHLYSYGVRPQRRSLRCSGHRNR